MSKINKTPFEKNKWYEWDESKYNYKDTYICL